MEQKGKDKNSTVAIAPDIAKKLDIFCKDKGITKKDFIFLSLLYFERYGINPAKHESPKAEMEKVTKRLDQFFAFMKKQEQDILRPMYADQINSTKTIISNLGTLIDSYNKLVIFVNEDFEKQSIKPLSTKVDAQKSTIESIKKESENLRKGLEKLLQFVDEKNKSGLIGKLFG